MLSFQLLAWCLRASFTLFFCSFLSPITIPKPISTLNLLWMRPRWLPLRFGLSRAKAVRASALPNERIRDEIENEVAELMQKIKRRPGRNDVPSESS